MSIDNNHKQCSSVSGEDARQFKIKFLPMDETLDANGQFRKHFPSYIDGLVTASPGGYVTFPEFPKRAEDIYNLKPRLDDVYVLTYPKSGTTWVQEMVWMIVNDCNFERGTLPLNIRSPFLEMNYMLPKSLTDQYERDAIVLQTKIPWISKFLEFVDYWKLRDVLRPMVKKMLSLIIGNVMREVEEIDQMTETRVVKSHLPLYLLNPKLLETSKVVYVARNPKDVIVSYFHYHRLIRFHTYTGDLETFAEYFMKDKVYASPFFPHLLDAWSNRHHPNLLFIFYEDLKKDLRGEITRVATFLGKSLSGDKLNQLAKHLSFDDFAKNESVNYEICKELGFMTSEGHFLRKGKTGDWKNHFSSELNDRIDRWISSQLEGSDLKFITELDIQD